MSRQPHQLVVLSSAARTATVQSQVYANHRGHRGLHLVIDVTAVTATPSVVPTIQGYDSISDKYYTLLTGSAITATGTTILKLYPGIATIANGAASDVLPAQFRFVFTHADSDSISYSVAAYLVG